MGEQHVYAYGDDASCRCWFSRLAAMIDEQEIGKEVRKKEQMQR